LDVTPNAPVFCTSVLVDPPDTFMSTPEEEMYRVPDESTAIPVGMIAAFGAEVPAAGGTESRIPFPATIVRVPLGEIISIRPLL
jgi:hypothetical protein